MTTPFQHMMFDIDLRDTATGDAQTFTFSGTRVEDGEDPKDVAVLHVAMNVVANPAFTAEHGVTVPVPGTFRLIRLHTPSDQGL